MKLSPELIGRLDALINELDGDFKDRWCLIVRPNDYPPDPDGPPLLPAGAGARPRHPLVS